MDREELEAWLENGQADVVKLDEWLLNNSTTLEDLKDMLRILLNSDMSELDLNKEFICFYEPREYRFGTGGSAAFTLEAEDVIALIESGDLV